MAILSAAESQSRFKLLMHVVDVCHCKVGGGVWGDVALLTGCLNQLLGLSGVSCQPAHVPAHNRGIVSLSVICWPAHDKACFHAL